MHAVLVLGTVLVTFPIAVLAGGALIGLARLGMRALPR
jgi:hypothetical protein